MKDYQKVTGVKTRWASFENPRGEKGKGGMMNGGAKGCAFEPMEVGEVKTLLDVQGSGVINRFWLTIPVGCHPLMDNIILRMYWDGSEAPAVEAPLGAFFCAALNVMKPFQSQLFSSPEGRSFNCFIQMPFVKGAKVTLANETKERISNLFYDINYQLCDLDPAEILYFHTHWSRETTTLCKDHTILPVTKGCGRYLGQSFGVRSDPAYGTLWFGEGEVKVYLDGDSDFPTLCGTGVEDYIGTAWSQGEYANMTQGCTLAYGNEKREFQFYRFHTVDPIYFERDIRVTVQAIGGGFKADVLKAIESGAKVRIVSGDENGKFACMFERNFELTQDSPDCWYNFYREDEYVTCAYYYIDRP